MSFIKAAGVLSGPDHGTNQLWQTDFTLPQGRRLGLGFYLSTILDDYSRYIIAWKLCTTIAVGCVTETLKLALQASG